MALDRRQFLTLMTLLAASASGKASQTEHGFSGLTFGDPQPFSWDGLVEKARLLSTQAYEPSLQTDRSELEQIDWEAHGQIHFKPEDALFAEGPGQYPVEFFHPGKFFQFAVHMYRLDRHGKDGLEAREILYDQSQFDIPPGSPAKKLGKNTRYAGFRLQESRLRNSGQPDWRYNDWAAFLGASYFRAIGDEYQYGLSARGVAINVLGTHPAEEFPAFTRFYFAPQDEWSHTVVLYALLDGPSITGAYRFSMAREAGVVMEVEARLFLRQEVSRLGIAPATSMYWFSGKDKRFQEDWRPEVHDSDGLALWTGRNEYLWRPLINPKGINLSQFSDKGPKGFGLVQRERHFSEYLDAVHYERRPSLWIEPMDDWGEGTVQLVELHTEEELYDNVVAMWVPHAPARAGDHFHFRYRLYWQADVPYQMPLARCVRTGIGRGGEPAKRIPGAHKFVVEFQGRPLEALPPSATVEAVVTASRGQVTQVFAEPVPGGASGHWRAIFDLGALAADSEPVDIRLFLRSAGQTLTETWLYQFHPE